MLNSNFEKVASIKKVTDFVGDVTGKTKRSAQSLAPSEDVLRRFPQEDIQERIRAAAKAEYVAREMTAAGALYGTGVAGGVVAGKFIHDKLNQPKEEEKTASIKGVLTGKQMREAAALARSTKGEIDNLARQRAKTSGLIRGLPDKADEAHYMKDMLSNLAPKKDALGKDLSRSKDNYFEMLELINAQQKKIDSYNAADIFFGRDIKDRVLLEEMQSKIPDIKKNIDLKRLADKEFKTELASKVNPDIIDLADDSVLFNKKMELANKLPEIDRNITAKQQALSDASKKFKTERNKTVGAYGAGAAGAGSLLFGKDDKQRPYTGGQSAGSFYQDAGSFYQTAGVASEDLEKIAFIGSLIKNTVGKKGAKLAAGQVAKTVGAEVIEQGGKKVIPEIAEQAVKKVADPVVDTAKKTVTDSVKGLAGANKKTGKGTKFGIGLGTAGVVGAGLIGAADRKKTEEEMKSDMSRQLKNMKP